MTLTNIANQREFEKFVQTTQGTAVKVANADGSNVGSSAAIGGSLASGIGGTLALGIYYSSPSTLANGQIAPINLDTNQNTIVTQGTGIAGEDLVNNVLVTENRYSYAFASLASNSKTITSSPGLVHSFFFGSISTPTTTIYDSATATGEIIARINPNTKIESIIFDWSFATALTLQVGGPGPTAQITVGYR